MMKKSFFIAATLMFSIVSNAQWDGDVFTEGCQAISQNDPRIVSWAKGVEVKRGPQAVGSQDLVTYGKAYNAQGQPDSTVYKCVSLGEGGMALATFDRPITNGEGKDFVVFENAFNSTFLELAFVEVSSNGVDFFRFPAQTTSSNSPEGRAAVNYNNLAGKYELGWGVGFDLSDIEDNPNLDKNNIRFVRLIDVIDGVDVDSQGNIIYDGYNVAPSYSAGFDLSAIGVINGSREYKICDFENTNFLNGENSYELTDFSHYDYAEGDYFYSNHLNNDLVFEGICYESYGYPMSIGFGASNIVDPQQGTGNGYASEYYTSSALCGLEGEGATYLQAYYSEWDAGLKHNRVAHKDDTTFYPLGVYVSLSLSAYNYIQQDANHNDGYLTLIAKGYDMQGEQTGAVEFDLCNYSADAQGEVLGLRDDWRYMNLESLGEVKEVVFSLASNYGNDYGMLVPAYFCIDNFVYTSEKRSTHSINEVEDLVKVSVYPNPASDYVNISLDDNQKSVVELFDIQGRRLLSTQVNDGHLTLNTSAMHGQYILKITANNYVKTTKLLVK